MRTILNDCTDPFYNLAWEEYIFKQIPCQEDILLLWQNAPSVIIGRNQNVWEEVLVEYVKNHQIPIIRRISGGGTVYHDLGNLNFTIITNDYKDSISNYKKFTEPLISALNDLGIKASFHGKSDVYIGDQKISGNAQSYYQNRMLHHGTILFDASLDELNHVLRKSDASIDSIGVKSNRSAVTNVSSHLKSPLSIHQFKDYLLKHWLKTDHIEGRIMRVTERDHEMIRQLMYEKYRTWEWNYGESPAFEKIGGLNQAKIRLRVDEGVIEVLEWIKPQDTLSLEEFKGCRFEMDAVEEILKRTPEIIQKPLRAFLENILLHTE
jgi:lipoate-protein ligase A